MLWSINERLCGRSGLELAPLGTAWLDDLMTIQEIEVEEFDAREHGAPDDDYEDDW